MIKNLYNKKEKLNYFFFSIFPPNPKIISLVSIEITVNLHFLINKANNEFSTMWEKAFEPKTEPKLSCVPGIRSQRHWSAIRGDQVRPNSLMELFSGFQLTLSLLDLRYAKNRNLCGICCALFSN